MDVYNIHYGTSGFRFTIENSNAIKSWNPDIGFSNMDDLAPFIIYRCGVALNIIANSNLNNNDNNFIGTIITASHNFYKDNGIKVFGSDGGLLNEFWETELEKLVNCKTDFNKYLLDNIEKYKIRSCDDTERDNRETGQDIIKILLYGINYGEGLFGKVRCIDMGLVCTSALAWCVRYKSINQDDYYKTLSDNWNLLVENIKIHSNNNINKNRLIIDTSQGSFSPKIDFIRNLLIKLGIDVKFYHYDYSKPINYECGSNYVMSNKIPSEILNDLNTLRGSRCVSFDGDADRLVYYIVDDKPIIADGDYILCLIVKYISNILSNYTSNDLTFGVLQTRYSNLSSTKFIQDIFEKLPKNIKCKHIYTETGVKYLKRATYGFDIAIFYESNGHGELIINTDKVPNELILLSNLSNPAMGDSVSNCLIVEACLYMLDLTIEDWLSIYTPIPSILFQLPLDNAYRNQFNRLLPEIVRLGDVLFSSYQNSRFLVRLSGTESCIRVFVESNDCIELIKKLEDLIRHVISDIYKSN